MIPDLLNIPKIYQMHRLCITDAGLNISIHPIHCDNDNGEVAIDSNRALVLKPDSYFDTIQFSRPPKMVDFCILFDENCKMNCNRISLLELKNTKDKNQLKTTEIIPKFERAVIYLLQGLFCDELKINIAENLNRIDAYLVTPFMDVEHNKSLLFDIYMNMMPISFQGKRFIIRPVGTNYIVN